MSHVLVRRRRGGLAYNKLKGFTEHNMRSFYKMFDDLVKENNIHPENMWNCDKSRFQPNNGGGLLYMNKENKHNHDLDCDNTKEKFTVMFCCSATGSWLPPFVLYKAKCMYQHWT